MVELASALHAISASAVSHNGMTNPDVDYRSSGHCMHPRLLPNLVEGSAWSTHFESNVNDVEGFHGC